MFGALLAVVGIAPAGLHAQGVPAPDGPRTTVVVDGIATPLPVSLRLPASPVALGLGNVAIVSRDADVLFYNPGMLSQAGGLAASAQRFGSAAAIGSFASIQTVGAYSLGLGARFVDWRSSQGSFERALRPGSAVFSQPGDGRASSLALTGGVGRGLGPLRLGLSATYLRESFRTDLDEALLLDAGVVMTVGPGFAGLTVQGLGGAVQLRGSDRTRPWRTTLGYGTRLFPVATFLDLSGVAQVNVDADGEVRPAGGLELSYVPIDGLVFTARAGARRTLDAGESTVTGGLGVSLDRVSLDYALDPVRGGAAAHRIGIRVR